MVQGRKAVRRPIVWQRTGLTRSAAAPAEWPSVAVRPDRIRWNQIDMLDLYTARSPVVFKVLIALEEMGLAFRSIPVDVTKGEQYTEAFTAVNPNSRIPALVDHAPADGGPPIALGESGAILVY